jgi:acyl-CoA ligase (AMP-forming) (exosortase A-associated)
MQYLVHHMLFQSASVDPNQEALVDTENRLDYATTAEQVASLASRLQALGVRRGDRVAIFLAPSVSLPLAILGVSMAGAAFVPIHHGLFPDQVAHILNDSGAITLITDNKRLALLQKTLAQKTVVNFAIVKQTTEESLTQNVVDIPLHDFDEMRRSTPLIHRDVSIEKDLAAILYTSGSTGSPKGVMLSHANILAGARIVAKYLSVTKHDRLLAALPLSFDAGLNQLTTAVLQGATTAMIDFRFGRDIAQRLSTERITGLAGVPSLWSLLAQPSSGLGKQTSSDLRYITNTGGVMPQNILGQLRELLPKTDVYLMYGLTEAFRSTYLPPSELDRRPMSMGRAIPNTEILVINEAGEQCGPDEVGELVHHGPTVSLGYWGDPDRTRQTLRPHPFPQPGRVDRDLVCYSGDLVKQDDEGFLYFVGRRDNQIKSAGFRISPNEVEDVICKVAAVRQAAVIGVPDPILGQHLVAFAVAEEKAEDLDPVEILANCANEIPRHMVPKQLVFIDQMPLTSNGKVNYTKLRGDLVSEN